MNAYATQIYRSRAVAAASSEQQMAMLLEMAARHLSQAMEAIERKDYEERYHATQKARTIIVGLHGTLENFPPEKAEAVATLDRYYTGLTMMLAHINVRNDVEACRVARDGLLSMAEGWRRLAAGSAPISQPLSPPIAVSLLPPSEPPLARAPLPRNSLGISA
jgi:flagellar biosynthetic protein FliS